MAKGKRKSSGKGKSLQQHLAESRQRGPGGRFLPVPKPTPAVPSATTQQVMQNQVDFLRAIIQQREEMGLASGTLDRIVLGIDNNLGIRKQLQDYITANASKFDVKDPAGRAAKTLFKETIVLSEQSLRASTQEAALIYEKLKFIRALAKKTQGPQSAVAKQLEGAIAPVEEQLKRQASFRQYVKENITGFARRLPETLASKIPIIGGLVGGFLQKKRETREDLERYSGDILQERAMGSASTGRISSAIGMLGGTPASAIPSLLSGIGGGDKNNTLVAIHAEVRKIRELLVDRFGPSTDELAARESELEGLRKAGLGGAEGSAAVGAMGGGGGLFGAGGLLGSGLLNLLPFLPFGGRARAARGVPVPLARRLGKGYGRLKLALGRSRVGRAIVGLGSMMGLGAAANAAIPSAASTAATEAKLAKAMTTSTTSAVAAKTASKSVVPSPVGGVGWWTSFKETFTNPKSWIKNLMKSGTKSVISGIVSIPGLGALLTAAISAWEISSIKSDPRLTADQKKDEIGKSLTTTLGMVLGSIGGGALGSVIPGLGTIAGAWGGSIIGALVASLLAEEIGGRGMYDMINSIPGLGDLIQVDGAEDQKTKTNIRNSIGQVNNPSETNGSAGQMRAKRVSGRIVTTTTPNTSVGKMVGSYNNEMRALSEAQAATAPTGTAITNNSSVNNKINNTTNNFNDDLRIRNNEPTIKQAQMMVHSPY